MANVLIVAYLLIVVALVAVILLQRSEGGGLGIGGSANAFMSVRGTANVLTRATGILAALFFAAAIGLTLLNGADRTTQNILERATQGNANSNTSVLDALNAAQQEAQKQSGATAPAPTTPAPATPVPPASQDAPNVALPAPANNNTAAPAAPTPAAPAATTPAAPATTPAPAASTPPTAPAGQ